MAKKETVTKEYYTITADDLKNKVNTYVELLAKTEWVSIVSDSCLDRVELSFMDEAIPIMYMENADRKGRFLLGFFLRLYLNWNWEHEAEETDADEWLVPYDIYDKWMRGHIFAQIEKFKSDKEVKDICFNLLAEYKDVERRLNNEIYGKLQVKNDPVTRQIMQQQMSVTPEAIEKLFDGLKDAQAAYDEYKEATASQEQETAEAEEGTADNG